MPGRRRDVRSDQRFVDLEDELYGAPPDDFVARRDAAARAAAQAGDRELADAIRSLRKPVAAARALNSFVRAKPAAIDALLDVGSRLREAVAAGDGDAIRSLMRERARAIARTLGDVRHHADEQGEPLSASVASQVEQTLRAASSSEEAARHLQRGVLTAPLADAGLDALGATTPGGRTSRRVAARASADGLRPDASEKDGERRADEAAEAVTRIELELEIAIRRRQELEAERAALRERLEDVDHQLQQLRRSESDAQSRLRTARSRLRSARRAGGVDRNSSGS